MGYLTLRFTMERISVATKRSPIAVFRCNKPEHLRSHLRSVFAATSETRRVLAEVDPDLIGVFNRDMDTAKVEKRLRRHIQRITDHTTGD